MDEAQAVKKIVANLPQENINFFKRSLLKRSRILEEGGVR